MWALLTSLALAGDIYEVGFVPDGISYQRVGGTGPDDGAIVTWPDQPLELVVVADLSGSILMDRVNVERIGDTIVGLHEAMADTNVPGDRFGVTVFASKPDSWIPLGRLDRPRLVDWLEAFGPPEEHPFRDEVRYDPALAWSSWQGSPAAPHTRAIGGCHETDAVRALKAARKQLAEGDPHALKAIVLLWDGGHNGFEEIEPALERAWTEEIHVWSVAPQRPIGALATTGGGDAFVARAVGPWVAERIVSEMRFPSH